MNQRSHKQKSKWVPASKMKGMTTKRKPKAKKPRRVVLGVGHPWFFAKLASGVDARAMFLTREHQAARKMP